MPAKNFGKPYRYHASIIAVHAQLHAFMTCPVSSPSILRHRYHPPFMCDLSSSFVPTQASANRNDTRKDVVTDSTALYRNVLKKTTIVLNINVLHIGAMQYIKRHVGAYREGLQSSFTSMSMVLTSDSALSAKMARAPAMYHRDYAPQISHFRV